MYLHPGDYVIVVNCSNVMGWDADSITVTVQDEITGELEGGGGWLLKRDGGRGGGRAQYMYLHPGDYVIVVNCSNVMGWDADSITVTVQDEITGEYYL